jgi:TOBE domain-containing protein
VTSKDGDRLVAENEEKVRVSVRAPGEAPGVGEQVLASVRAASVQIDEGGEGPLDVNSAECEIVFVEFLGDLVKLHLESGGERMLAKVPGEQYPSLRGREGEKIRIRWEEDDAQLLRI